MKDLDASLAFYPEVLGLERPTCADLGDPGLGYMGPPGGAAADRGIFPAHRPQRVEALGCRVRLVEDPSGVELELMQK